MSLASVCHQEMMVIPKGDRGRAERGGEQRLGPCSGPLAAHL